MKRYLTAALIAASMFAVNAFAGTEGFTPVKCLIRPALCR